MFFKIFLFERERSLSKISSKKNIENKKNSFFSDPLPGPLFKMSFVLQTKGNIMKLYSEVGRRFLEVDWREVGSV
jgi:hypothetical protein